MIFICEAAAGVETRWLYLLRPLLTTPGAKMFHFLMGLQGFRPYLWPNTENMWPKWIRKNKRTHLLYFVCSHLEVLELRHHVLIAEVVFLVVPCSTRNKSCTEVAGAHFFDRPKRVSCRSFANPLPRLRRCVPGTERPPQGWERSQLIKRRDSNKKKQQKRNCNHIPQKG